jgi:hypothetical protein
VKSFCLFSFIILFAGSSAWAEPPQRPAIQAPDDLSPATARDEAIRACSGTDFNACVVATTRLIYSDRRNKGYNTDGVFTKALDYGPDSSVIKASSLKPETMCVAATSEIVIETLNHYYSGTQDRKPFDIIPASSWNNSTRTDIRSYIWENEGPSDKRGAGTAFASFGAGELIDFKNAKPGDFISLDRSKFRPRVSWTTEEIEPFSKKKLLTFEGQQGVWQTSGHSTTFLGYLDKSLKWTDKYDVGRIVGFLYFSSQGGHASNGGFGYRWAIFKDSKSDQNRVICEIMPTLSARLDCNLGGVDPQVRAGRLWHPSKWNAARPAQLRNEIIKEITASIQPLARRDLNILGRNADIPNARLNLPDFRSIVGKAPSQPLNALVQLLVEAQLQKENPTFDAERFNGVTD